MRRLLPAARGGTGGFTVPPTYPPTGNTWTRAPGNPIIVASAVWEGGASGWVLEPNVFNFGDGYYTMFYTGGVAGTGTDYAMGRATCPIGSSPLVAANWTKYASNPVLGKGGSGYAGVCSRSSFIRDGATLWNYFGDGADLYRSSSTDLGFTWTTPVLVKTAASAGHGATQMTNSAIWREANDWKMLLEIVGGTTAQWYDRIGYLTSPDGLSWTIQNGGVYLPTLLRDATYSASCAPWLIREGPTYHLWLHGNTAVSGLPQDGLHSSSTDLITWTTPTVVMTHLGSGTFEYDQFADLSLVVVASTAYLFYCGANNTVNEGGPWFKIGVASAPAVYSMG